jgi:hypothetical protein
MRPRPPTDFAARRLAAVIRPPLLFFTVITPSLVLTIGKEPINRDVAKRFLKAFRQWLLDHPEFGGRRTLDKQVTR